MSPMPNSIAARVKDPLWADIVLLVEFGYETGLINGPIRGDARSVIAYVDLVWSVA